MVEDWERPICSTLIELFDRYEVPATWAIVASLLDAESAISRPGGESCWYAPDIIDRILQAKTDHEIGNHGGRHVYFDDIDASRAVEDLAYARDVHHSHSLPFDSFVFPRNLVGHLSVVANSGLQVFRGPETGWVSATRGLLKTAGRAAHLTDKLIPLSPKAVIAKRCEDLVDVPASMLLLGRNGLRRLVSPSVSRSKLAAGLERAQSSGGIFHLWFHPSNFYYRREEQFATFEWFLEVASARAAQGLIDFRTMGSYANVT